MRRLGLLAGLALTVSILLPGSALAAVGGSDLPVMGSHAGDCTENIATLQGRCVTTGRISHFGVTTMEQDFQSTGLGTGSTFSGTWTLTVANGDQVFGTSAGTTYTADGVHFLTLGTWVSSGGTGRLAEANLTIDATVQLTSVSVEGGIVTFAGEVTLVGRLSY